MGQEDHDPVHDPSCSIWVQPNEAIMSPDEQAALSRKYSDEAIILLPLPSGNWAVMNRGFELCSIIDGKSEYISLSILKTEMWHRPPPTPNFSSKPKPTLEDLGL